MMDSVPRIEDPALLRGQGRFLDDIQLPDMLHVAFVRSPHAHAVIRGIDKQAALEVPGVHTVLTLADLSEVLTGERLPLGFGKAAGLPADITPFVLCKDEVCFVGEAVAAVLADDRYIAEDGAGLVVVDYDPLPAAVDCRDAMADDAPVARQANTTNLLATFDVGYGDCSDAFHRADHVIAVALKHHRGGAHPIEGRGAVAQPSPIEDRLTLWTSTQMAHEVRALVVKMLGCDEAQLRVVAPDVGGGFGAKFLTYPEEIVVAAAARMLARPVKWVEDRREHFLSAIQNRDQYWNLEIAVDHRARILGVRGEMIHDQGAYTPQGLNLPQNSALSVTGPYVVPSYQLNVSVVETNKVYTIPVRGAGYPEAAFAMERLLDKVARELGLDRAEVRRRNLITADQMPYELHLKARSGSPMLYDSGDFLECQAQALAAADYDSFPTRQDAARADGRYIGIGIANGVKGTGRGPFESAIVRIGRSGQVFVHTAAMPMGQGIATALAQICGESLGIDAAAVRVIAGDTDAISMGLGGFASRQTVTAGSAVHLAAEAVRDQAIDIAAMLLKTTPDTIVLKDGRAWDRDRPEQTLTLGELAEAVAGVPGYSLISHTTTSDAKPGLEATRIFMPESLAYCNGCHVAEVAVDIDTGAVTLLRYVVVNDSGRLINPMIANGQLQGGVVHGIGNALFEKMAFDKNGQPVTTTFAEYLLPTATEVIDCEIINMQSPSTLNPLGVKGIGEAGCVPAAAAIASAVEDALTPFAVRIDEIPITPERLVEHIHTQSSTSR
ncbi:MAG: xanthine dehydrogenase family protein molybdopterin-binding subunit [Alphaproteobacteria bacterium]|nr:xanthine dehydrogenase family protein molybdopterin-binding subunit [Alphaproteobacteria bacterium]